MAEQGGRSVWRGGSRAARQGGCETRRQSGSGIVALRGSRVVAVGQEEGGAAWRQGICIWPPPCCIAHMHQISHTHMRGSCSSVWDQQHFVLLRALKNFDARFDSHSVAQQQQGCHHCMAGCSAKYSPESGHGIGTQQAGTIHSPFFLFGSCLSSGQQHTGGFRPLIGKCCHHRQVTDGHESRAPMVALATIPLIASTAISIPI